MATPRKNTSKPAAKPEVEAEAVDVKPEPPKKSPKPDPSVQDAEVPADPPKSTQGMRPVQFSEPVATTPEDLPADDSEGELVTEEGAHILFASSLVRNNEYARNSRSVRAVQDALVALGQWEVGVDPKGYWGPYTQDAAVAVTGEEDPVAAAEWLGFTVI